jgi:hypothetical protein
MPEAQAGDRYYVISYNVSVAADDSASENAMNHLSILSRGVPHLRELVPGRNKYLM